MTAHVVPRRKARRKFGNLLILPFTFLVLVLAAAGSLVAYLLWPTWPSGPISLDAPDIPITVAGALFNVPMAAIRTKVQRHAGAHERIDLVLLWPSLTPPRAAGKPAAEPISAQGTDAAAPPPAVDDRLFVTIAGLGAVLPPVERLRTIYPRYVEDHATAGPDQLATLAFRAGTPYAGEDLVYFTEKPEDFFARCTRKSRVVPATCTHERALDAAEITLRFPREWLDDWRGVAAGFDRLIAQLHPRTADSR